VKAAEGGTALLAVGGGDPHVTRARVEEDAEVLVVCGGGACGWVVWAWT
jgi:hypothetical protein